MANRNHQNSPNLIIRINGMDDVLEAASQTHFATRVQAFVSQEGLPGLNNRSALVRIAQECFPGKCMEMSLSLSNGALVLNLNALKNVRVPRVRPVVLAKPGDTVQVQAQSAIILEQELNAKNEQIRGMAAKIKRQKAQLSALNAPKTGFCEAQKTEVLKGVAPALGEVFIELFNNHNHKPGDPATRAERKTIWDKEKAEREQKQRENSDLLLNTQNQLECALERCEQKDAQIDKLNEIIRTERDKRFARADLKILTHEEMRKLQVKSLVNRVNVDIQNGSWHTAYFQRNSSQEELVKVVAELFKKAGYTVEIKENEANGSARFLLPLESAIGSNLSEFAEVF